jgi:hypothetical protein
MHNNDTHEIKSLLRKISKQLKKRECYRVIGPPGAYGPGYGVINDDGDLVFIDDSAIACFELSIAVEIVISDDCKSYSKRLTERIEVDTEKEWLEKKWIAKKECGHDKT